MPTPQELFDQLGQRLASKPSLTTGLNATFQFDISGPQGGQWYVRANNGSAEVSEGTVPDPNMTAHMTDEVFVDVATGNISGQEAFFTGKIKVDGEATLGIYLGQFFGS